MEIKGYVNPRSLGNSEPNALFGMDVFFEEQLWEKYIAHKDEVTRDTHVYDVCWMLRCGTNGPASIQQREQTFKVFLNGKETTLRTNIHPKVMALCVGLPQ